MGRCSRRSGGITAKHDKHFLTIPKLWPLFTSRINTAYRGVQREWSYLKNMEKIGQAYRLLPSVVISCLLESRIRLINTTNWEMIFTKRLSSHDSIAHQNIQGVFSFQHEPEMTLRVLDVRSVCVFGVGHTNICTCEQMQLFLIIWNTYLCCLPVTYSF